MTRSAPWSKYEPTAARRHGKPGREIRPKSVTIDCHAHVVVPAAAALARPYLTPEDEPLAFYTSPESKAVGALQGRDRTPLMTSYEPRLQHLDAMGLDRQVIKPAPGMCFHSVPVEIGVKAAVLVNDGIAEYAAKHAGRFIPFGTVPMQDGAAAAAELERCHKQLGFKGVQILTNVAGRELSDPAFAPFWAKAEALGMLVVIHPNGFTEGKRLAKHYFSNVVGNPFDTALALHYLIFDGVLARHPNLKLLAVHGGGYLPSYAGRIDHAWGARSDCRGEDDLSKPPSEYLKQVYVDTVVFSIEQLEYLVRFFGPDHVLMGTDYPFDMGEYDPVGHVMTADLDASAKAAICGGNLERLIGK